MNVDWKQTHWTDGLGQELIDSIEYECERQHVDETRRGYLRAGWELARKHAVCGDDLTLDILLEIAQIVEPTNGGKIRTTPVVFDSGGYAVPAENLPAAMDQLIRFWPEVDASDEEKHHWVREFLVAHPFSDGNGRVAYLLVNWLFDSWDSPMRLPYYQF